MGRELLDTASTDVDFQLLSHHVTDAVVLLHVSGCTSQNTYKLKKILEQIGTGKHTNNFVVQEAGKKPTSPHDSGPVATQHRAVAGTYDIHEKGGLGRSVGGLRQQSV